MADHGDGWGSESEEQLSASEIMADANEVPYSGSESEEQPSASEISDADDESWTFESKKPNPKVA